MPIEMEKPQTPREALELALFLAVTAPSEAGMREAQQLAEGFASSLTEFEVRRAMRSVETMLGVRT